MKAWYRILIIWATCFLVPIPNALALHHKPPAHHQKHHPKKTHTHAKTQTTHPLKKPNQPQVIKGSYNLTLKINSIIKEVDPNAAIGITIKSMKGGELLYARNDHRLFVPASVLKIFVAEAALLYLGPEYKFPTTLLTDGTAIQSGLIDGNFYLVQTGDPTLTYYDLVDLMTALKAQDIEGITGNFYIDTTAYDQVNFGPGWIWDDKRYCYAAPINASIINHNCLSFKMAPAKKAGQLALIVPSPRYYYGSIHNSVVTKNSPRNCNVQLASKDNILSVSGCMPKGKEVWGVSAVVGDITEYNKSLIHSLLKQYKVHVKGEVNIGAAPPHVSAVAIHESKPLRLLINDMLKMSDNIIAGSLLKKMGEFHARQPGSWKNGSEAVKQILAERASVDPREMIILDGSGLSKENRIKPSQMMQVLDFAFHNYSTNAEFISALPIAGVDGTLKHRLGNVTRKVRAKTGTLAGEGVVALAGYAVSKDKEPIAFVIMVNGRSGNVWQYREMEDRIVTALTQYMGG